MIKVDGKVSRIEFHISHYEIDDFIVRAAELIKEGYRFYSVKEDPILMSGHTIDSEPKIHIILQKRGIY